MRAIVISLMFYMWLSACLVASNQLETAQRAEGQCTVSGECQENVLAGSNAPVPITSEAVPSRSGGFPTNLIHDGAIINEIGQRPFSNEGPVWFTLHPNGDGLDEGVRIDSKSFPEVDAVIGEHCCKMMGMDEARCAPASGARLVTETGIRMLSFNDVESGQRVYCVPQGVHFVWPLKKTGFVVYPKNVVGPKAGQPIRLRQLSEKPRVFSVDNFVSDAEVEELLSVNSARITPSEVGFGGWQDDTRTSQTAWDDTTEASKAIRTRTFQILGMDEDLAMADTLQVLRYRAEGKDGKGEWYKPHVDWFGADSYDGHDPLVNNGSNRFATMFLYLSDVEEGGATVFPLSTTHEGYNGEKLVHDGTADTPGYINTLEARYCCNASSSALRSKPIKGNAVLFYSQGPDGALDAYSLHGGCPPIKGVKWSANVWIWNRKSPDKSVAKDKPPADGDGMSVSFLNGRLHSIEIHWDEDSASPDYEDLPEDLQELQAIVAGQPDRFKAQLTLEARREAELSSYEGHAFIAVDLQTNKAIWSGVVQSPGQLFEIY